MTSNSIADNHSFPPWHVTTVRSPQVPILHRSQKTRMKFLKQRGRGRKGGPLKKAIFGEPIKNLGRWKANDSATGGNNVIIIINLPPLLHFSNGLNTIQH